jgi:hypothetical protein
MERYTASGVGSTDRCGCASARAAAFLLRQEEGVQHAEPTVQAEGDFTRHVSENGARTRFRVIQNRKEKWRNAKRQPGAGAA